jgi:Pentapeptide repeats (8 copies)
MPRLVIALLYLLLVPGLARSAEIPLREVVDILFKAPPASHPDFAGKDLSSLDLSGLDFKQARLTGANLLGDDLSDANFSKVDLSGATTDATCSRCGRSERACAAILGPSRDVAEGPDSEDSSMSAARPLHP